MIRTRALLILTTLALLASACNTPTPTVRPPTPGPATPTAPVAVAPTPTPRPLGNPIVVDRSPARGEELALDKPITLVFDQAMDRTSVEQAIRIRSNGTTVSGSSFEWTRDNAVTIKPPAGWETATSVEVDVADTAKSARGLKLGKVENFKVNAVGGLFVAQTLPGDKAADVSADSGITVLFNRPVVALTLLDQQAALPKPVTFSPALEGRGEWLNTSIYVFRPAQALLAGVAYRGTVAAGLKDTTGAVLKEDYVWTFNVAAPIVKKFSPAQSIDVDLRQPISVTFSQKMDRASAEAAFSISPAVKGSFRWANESPDAESRGAPASLPGGQPALAQTGEVMGFWPDGLYERNTGYNVTVKAGARGRAGAGTQNNAGITFRTLLNLAIQSTRPANGATNWASGSGVQARFTSPILPETVMPNVRFEPAISLTRVYSYYNQFDRSFVISGPFEASRRYTVTFGAAIADKYGQTLGRDAQISFTTDKLPPFFALQTRAQVGTYNAGVPTRLFSSYRNVSQLNFNLYALSLQEFYQMTGPDRAYETFRSLVPERRLRAWTQRSEAGLNESAVYRIAPAADGGALAPGIYLLTASAPEMRAEGEQRHILVVSNLQVAVKNGERDALAWVTELTTGKPVAGAPVTLRGEGFDLLGGADARTTPEGIAAWVSPAKMEPFQPVYAIVGQPGEARFGLGLSRWASGIEPWDFNLPTRFGEEPLRAYVYTDRPIYRPGQIVYFKGALRDDDDARYSLPATPGVVEIIASNDQGQQVYSASLPLSGAGTFSGAITLDNSAGTGYYNVAVRGPSPLRNLPQRGDEFSVYGAVGFQVATYRRPEFEVSVTPARTDIVGNGTVTAVVEARYFFGGNVAGAKVEWSLLQRDFFFNRYAGEGGYAFDDYDYFSFGRGPGFNEPIASGTGVIGPDGRLVVDVPVDIARRKNGATLILEASVTDADDASVAARAEMVAHKGPIYYGITTEDYVAKAGGQTKALIVTVDTQGKPVPDTETQVVLTRREWFTTQIEDAAGNREYDSVPRDTPVLTRSVRTGADGKASVSIDVKDGGEYRLVASAMAPGGPRGAAFVYVSSQAGAYVTWRVNNNDRIDVKADKAAYKVGDTAKILVPSPFSGTVTALVTVERGRILSTRLVTLKTNSDIIEVPVDASMAPNAYVSVMIVKGIDERGGLPAFRLGYASFKVDPGAFGLTIELKPDRKTYRPRDTVTYDIRVTDVNGRPVQAELSLALVDKAILSLAEPNSLGILDYFYGARGLGIHTASSLSVNVDRVTAALAAEYGKGGGGGGLASAADGVFTRENFKDTAYWSATIETSAAGEARAQIVLPDNLTTWRLDARALTRDTRVGQAINDVVSSKPLLVRPVVPRFFVAGDTATIGAVVNNNTDADVETDISIEAKGVRVTSALTQKATVKAGLTARVDWVVIAEDAAAADLTFSAKGSAYQDSAKPGLATAPGGGIPILRYSAPENIGTAGDLSEPGKRLELLGLPQRLDTGRGSLEIQVDASLASATHNGRLALERSIYEDNETTASRLIAALAEMTTPGRPTTAARADALESIQRLLNYQLSSGGWCWWRNELCQANTSVSAWAYMALAMARRAGLPVDAGELSRAERHVRGTLVGVGAPTSARAANQQAFVTFALAEAGATGIQPQLNLLYEQREKLDYWARALVAMSIATLNPADSALRSRSQTMLSDLANAGIASATGLSWQEKQPDWYNFASNTRTTAMALLAFARLDPSNALLPNATRWLMVARQGDTWETNQEIAWAVLALTEWMKASGELNPNYDWRVTLNDDSVLNGKATAETLATPSTLTIDVSKLLRGQTNQIGFERGAGTGRLYYTARLKAFVPADTAKAVNRGITIARKYELADCQPKADTPCPAVTSAKIGQTVRVRLTIVAPSDLYFVRLSDAFPAGMEAVDSSLLTTAQSGPAAESGPSFGSAGGWGWWWFGNKDLRDERIDVYADSLPRGTYEYTYLLRAGMVGQFQAIPALIEQRYFPEVFGRSDGAAFRIER
jgi:uncharacterized protein YfaS (alpha-2-macroglobulin family)